MDVITIKYCFTFKDGSQQVFNLQLDAQKLELLGNTQESLPLWTKLDFAITRSFSMILFKD